MDVFPGTPASLAALSPRNCTTSPRASALHGIPSATAKPPFAPARDSSMAPPAATSGTSPATRSPYAVRQTFVTVHSFSNIYAPTMLNGTASASPEWRSVPVHLNPKNPSFLAPASIEIDWDQDAVALHLPVQSCGAAAIARQVALTAAYVGTLSRDVPTMIDGNYAPYGPASTATSGKRKRPPALRSPAYSARTSS